MFSQITKNEKGMIKGNPLGLLSEDIGLNLVLFNVKLKCQLNVFYKIKSY